MAFWNKNYPFICSPLRLFLISRFSSMSSHPSHLKDTRFEVHNSSTSHDITHALNEFLVSWVFLYIVIAIFDTLKIDDEAVSEAPL
jgi:hypothetical protein